MQVRPKYRLDSNKDKPTAATPQLGAAKLPDEAVDKQPAEPPVESDAVKDAERNALKARLAEMENAEKLQRAAPTMQERMATEPQQRQPQSVEEAINSWGLPDRAKNWLREHSEFVTDPAKNVMIQRAHADAVRLADGDAFSNRYFDQLEILLGLKPQSRSAILENRPPPRPQPRNAAPVSAPISRDVPSMTTGRPTSGPVRLTQEEHDLAASLKISPQEYQEQKARMLRLKASGAIQT